MRPFQPQVPQSPEPRREMELGDELGPKRRISPSADEIRQHMPQSLDREHFFSDEQFAQTLGFRGILVPGPMLSAFLEQFLRRELPGWHLERLSTTFRVPTVAGDPLVLHGAITERHETADGERLVCDLVIEHGNGERCVTGTATLRRACEKGSGGPAGAS